MATLRDLAPGYNPNAALVDTSRLRFEDTPVTPLVDVAPMERQIERDSMTQTGLGYKSSRLSDQANWMEVEAATREAAGDVQGAQAMRGQINGLRQQAAFYAPAEQDITQVGLNPGRILDYGLGAVGSVGASMQDSLLAGGAVRGAGALLKQSNNPLVKGAGLAAAFVPNLLSNSGEQLGQYREDPNIMANTTAGERLARGLGTGVVMGALDTIPEAGMLSRVAGKGAGGILRNTALDTGKEMATEVAQTGVQKLDLGLLNPERDTSNDWRDYANAAAQAGLGSAPLHGLSNTIGAMGNRVREPGDPGVERGDEIDLKTGKKLDGSLSSFEEQLKSAGSEARFKSEKEALDYRSIIDGTGFGEEDLHGPMEEFATKRRDALLSELSKFPGDTKAQEHAAKVAAVDITDPITSYDHPDFEAASDFVTPKAGLDSASIARLAAGFKNKRTKKNERNFAGEVNPENIGGLVDTSKMASADPKKFEAYEAAKKEATTRGNTAARLIEDAITGGGDNARMHADQRGMLRDIGKELAAMASVKKPEPGELFRAERLGRIAGSMLGEEKVTSALEQAGKAAGAWGTPLYSAFFGRAVQASGKLTKQVAEEQRMSRSEAAAKLMELVPAERESAMVKAGVNLRNERVQEYLLDGLQDMFDGDESKVTEKKAVQMFGAEAVDKMRALLGQRIEMRMPGEKVRLDRGIDENDEEHALSTDEVSGESDEKFTRDGKEQDIEQSVERMGDDTAVFGQGMKIGVAMSEALSPVGKDGKLRRLPVPIQIKGDDDEVGHARRVGIEGSAREFSGDAGADVKTMPMKDVFARQGIRGEARVGLMKHYLQQGISNEIASAKKAKRAPDVVKLAKMKSVADALDKLGYAEWVDKHLTSLFTGRDMLSPNGGKLTVNQKAALKRTSYGPGSMAARVIGDDHPAFSLAPGAQHAAVHKAVREVIAAHQEAIAKAVPGLMKADANGQRAETTAQIADRYFADKHLVVATKADATATPDHTRISRVKFAEMVKNGDRVMSLIRKGGVVDDAVKEGLIFFYTDKESIRSDLATGVYNLPTLSRNMTAVKGSDLVKWARASEFAHTKHTDVNKSEKLTGNKAYLDMLSHGVGALVQDYAVTLSKDEMTQWGVELNKKLAPTMPVDITGKPGDYMLETTTMSKREAFKKASANAFEGPRPETRGSTAAERDAELARDYHHEVPEITPGGQFFDSQEEADAYSDFDAEEPEDSRGPAKNEQETNEFEHSKKMRSVFESARPVVEGAGLRAPSVAAPAMYQLTTDEKPAATPGAAMLPALKATIAERKAQKLEARLAEVQAQIAEANKAVDERMPDGKRATRDDYKTPAQRKLVAEAKAIQAELDAMGARGGRSTLDMQPVGTQSTPKVQGDTVPTQKVEKVVGLLKNPPAAPAQFQPKETAKLQGADLVLAPTSVAKGYAGELARAAQAEGVLYVPGKYPDMTGKTLLASVPGKGRGFTAMPAFIERVKKALEAGAVVRTDNKDNAERAHNAEGEGALRQALVAAGYAEKSGEHFSEWVKPTPKPITRATTAADAIQKRQEYLDNPPADYTTEKAQTILKWAKASLERANARKAELTGDALEDLADNIGALKRLVAKAESVLEGDESLKDFEGPKLNERVFSAQDADTDKTAQKAQNTGTQATPSEAEIDAVRGQIGRLLGPQIKVLFEKVMDGNGSWDDVTKTVTIALAPLAQMSSVAYHEGMHGFFSQHLKDRPEVREMLFKAVAEDRIRERVQFLLRNSPAALKAIARDPEEAVAYAFEFWAEGLLDMGKAPATFFEKVQRFFRGVFGLIADSERALEIFQALHDGKMVEPSAAEKAIQEAMERGEGLRAKALAADKQGRWLKTRIMAANRIVAESGPVGQALANMWYVNPGSQQQGTEPGVMNRRQMQTNKYTNRLMLEVFAGLSDQDMKDLDSAAASKAEVSSIENPKVKKALANLYKLNADMYRYVTQAGVQLGIRDDGKYTPMVWNQQYMIENKDKFISMLVEKYLDRLNLAKAAAGQVESKNLEPHDVAAQMWQAIIDRTGVDAKLDAQREDGVLSPFFASENGRSFDWIAPEDRKEFLTTNLTETMTAYIHQAVRSAEYVRTFGVGGRDLQDMLQRTGDFIGMNKDGTKKFATTDGPLIKEIRAKAIADKVPEDQLEAYVLRRHNAVRDSVGAMEGVLGKDISDKARKLNSYLMTYQHLRLLPLSLFAAMLDPIGIMVSGGKLDDTISAYVRGMKGVVKTWKSMATGIPLALDGDEDETNALLVGTLDSNMFLEAMGNAHTSEYMDSGVRKINHTFFKLNGLTAWDRNMRISATRAGISFIMSHDKNSNPQHSARWLETLGLKQGELIYGPDGKLVLDARVLANLRAESKAGGADKLAALDADKRQALIDGEVREAEKYANKLHFAIQRFVQRGVLSPNAAVRPAWASDPHYAAIFHLKQYTYGFHEIIMRHVKEEAMHGNYGPGLMALTGVPVMIASDITKGLITGGGSLPGYMANWGLADWLTHGWARAGLNGIGQIGIDAIHSPAGLLGPTADQVWKTLWDPLGKLEKLDMVPGARVVKGVVDNALVGY